MTEHLPTFRRHLAQRGYSTLSARDYTQKARQFHAWLDGRPVTEALLRQYRAELRQRTAAPASVRGSLAALSLWFHFLELNRLASGLPPVPPPLDPGESRQGRRPRPQ